MTRDHHKSSPDPESDDHLNLQDAAMAAEAIARPDHIIRRAGRYAKNLFGDSDVFSKFMAAKGGLMAMVYGVLLLPAVFVSGVSMAAVVLTGTALGLITVGVFGAVRFTRHMWHDIKNGFATIIQGKPAVPHPKGKTPGFLKKPVTKVKKSGAVKKIKSSAPVSRIRNNPVLQRVKKIGTDQEILMRAYATTGAVGTIVLTGSVLVTQMIALPAVTLSLATIGLITVASSAVSGVISLGYNGIKLIKRSRDQIKTPLVENTPPNQNHQLSRPKQEKRCNFEADRTVPKKPKRRSEPKAHAPKKRS